jgi:hypothetical protein
VTNNRDEEGLSWGDENDPTHIEAPQQEAAARTQARPDAPSLRRGVAERRERARSAQAADAVAGARADARAHGSADRALAYSTESDADSVTEPAPMGSVLLVVLGILGGVYLLYTVGWFTTATRSNTLPIGALDVVMARLRSYLSVAAPVLWFVTTLVLTRRRRPVLRVLWLLLGVIVLLPLPFVLESWS